MRSLVLVVVLLVAAGCSTTSPDVAPTTAVATTTATATTATPAAPETPVTTAAPTTTTTESTTTTVDPVVELVASMSREDKIGQMLMPVVRGTGIDTVSSLDTSYNQSLGGFSTPAEMVAAYRLGGLMYLGPNVESPAQIQEFSAGLQTVALDNGLVPMMIAADQEGGRVRRVRGEGVTDVASARSLSGSSQTVFATSALNGTQMKAIGINVVFAPVADVVRSDVGVIGNRSYGSDPEVVGDMVSASIDGLQLGGVGAVAKHWPGHGATEVDSHKFLPTVTSSEEEWRTVDLPPFLDAIDAGVDAMMVGHLAVPSLGADQPATISPRLTDELIRSELGFGGVLFTDAMDMRALDGIAEAELAVLVIEAGIDILLVPPDLRAAVAGITEALESGRLTEERIDLSVERILRMKQNLDLIEPG